MSELPDKVHFRPDEVAKYFDVDIKTVYRWCDERAIQYFKLKGVLRIKRVAIEKFEERNNIRAKHKSLRKVVDKGLR